MKYTLKNFLEKIIKSALLCSSFAAFYITFLVSVSFIKMVNWYTFIFVLDIFYLISRILYRIHLLKECDYIEIEKSKINYSEDQKIRANYLGDIMGIIIYIVLIVSIQNPNSSLLNGMMSIPLTYGFIYFACAYVSVLKNFVSLKALTILSSTIQGVMVILLAVLYVLKEVLYYRQQIAQQGVSVDTVTIRMTDLAQGIIYVSYILEEYPIFTIIPIIISIVLFVLYIYMTPVYQLSKLKFAFQAVNIFMVLIGILSFFLANYFGEFINVHKILMMNSSMYQKFVEEVVSGKIYFENFGTSNIKNLFYLAVLPYTFGILTANVIMELRVKYAERKSADILEKLKEVKVMTNEDRMQLRKKYYYFGGKKHNFDIYEKVYSDKNDFSTEIS